MLPRYDSLLDTFVFCMEPLMLFTFLDLCVSSLRRGHANFLCIVPSLTDDPRRESVDTFVVLIPLCEKNTPPEKNTKRGEGTVD